MQMDLNAERATLPADRAESVEDAYALCRRITHHHGANFSVGFRFLPKRKRNAVYASYAFCRWVDDVADEPGENVPQRLDESERELDLCYAGKPRHPITLALADALKHFPIPKSAFLALIEGCRQDLVKSRYETFAELIDYCDLVATSISDISLPIFEYKSQKALEYGRNLAIALQLTNVTRDIGDDLERDRIYVPLEELRRFGVSESDLARRAESPQVLRLIEFQISRAAGYFERAQPLLGELSWDARFPTLLMGGVYATVLRRLERDPGKALRDRFRLSTAAKIGVVLRRLIVPRF